jgi:hypothetical protein
VVAWVAEIVAVRAVPSVFHPLEIRGPCGRYALNLELAAAVVGSVQVELARLPATSAQQPYPHHWQSPLRRQMNLRLPAHYRSSIEQGPVASNRASM